MNAQQHNQLKELIPDLLPLDYVSLNTKRINFIYGQGVIIYNQTYAVEIYMPRDKKEEITFFAVDRHFGNVGKIGQYYRKMPVLKYDDPRVTPEMRAQFEEAIYQNEQGTNNIKELYNKGMSRQVA